MVSTVHYGECELSYLAEGDCNLVVLESVPEDVCVCASTEPTDYEVTTFPKCRQSKTDSNAEASAVFLFIPSRQQPVGLSVGPSVRPSRVLPFTAPTDKCRVPPPSPPSHVGWSSSSRSDGNRCAQQSCFAVGVMTFQHEHISLNNTTGTLLLRCTREPGDWSGKNHPRSRE